MDHQKETSTHLQPWGRAIGLIAACLVVLTGIFRDVGPAEIVIRAFTAAVLTAMTVRGFIWLLVICSADPAEYQG